MDLAALITVVIGTTSLSLGWATLLTRTLGERIGSLETSMNGRFGSVETRLNAVEGALRAVGERLTTLKTDLGKR